MFQVRLLLHLAVGVQQALVLPAGSQLIGLGHKGLHAAVGQSGGHGLVDGGQQRLVALAHANGGAFAVIGDIQNDLQLGIVLLIALGHVGLNVSAVQLAGQQLGDQVGDLGQGDDISVGGILIGQVHLDGAGLAPMEYSGLLVSSREVNLSALPFTHTKD